MRYRQVQDGEWVKPRMRNYYMKCCDCGLVHKMDFKVIAHARGPQDFVPGQPRSTSGQTS